jgi:predicted MFS family arabinose efflux permease
VLKHDSRYEFSSVALLTVGFGLVGLDRWIIAPLFPSIVKDLGLSYSDLGNLVGALGLAWGACAILAGGLSDRWGRRKVLVPAIVGFSLLSGFTGLAGSLTALISIRVLMGITEGAFCPTSFATTAEASAPHRRGFNLGVQQSAFPLFGLALGPILATQLLLVIGWRWIFLLVAVPGLLVGVLIWRIIREPRIEGVAAGSSSAGAHAVGVSPPAPRPPLRAVFRHPNVLLGMLALMCAMSGVFVLGAMVPNYLVDYLGLSVQQMGFVTSAIGFGGFLGQVVLPGASDIFGRKPMMLLGFVFGALFLYGFAQLGAQPVMLFALLFVASIFCFGLLGLVTGPIATEAAPAGLMSSTAGLIVGSGEIFGGGIAPVIAGNIAQRFGIQHVLTMALCGLAAGAVVSVFLRETAPAKSAGAMPRQADAA